MKIDLSNIDNKKNKKSKSIRDLLKKKTFSLKVSDKTKSVFYKELKILLNSGITIEESLSIIEQNSKHVKLREKIKIIREDLLKGKTLVKAMEDLCFFSPFEINTVRIGEETNNLSRVVNELEVFFQKKHRMKSQILTVLTYPILIIFITLGVLVFMLKNVVPMFQKVFKQFGSDLPSLTKKVIYISDNFSLFFSVFLLLILLFFLIFVRFKGFITQKGSFLILKLPFLGKLVKDFYMSRLCQSMSLLLSSKVSINDSLSFIKSMIGFFPIMSTIDPINENVIKGASLSSSMEKFEFYDKSFISMIKISEEVNELDKMFEYLSDQYSNEIEVRSKRIGVVIEPFIIIIIGLIVGVIMIAMYLPMLDLSKILNTTN